MRLSATKSLMERRDVVIVATVSAIYGIGNPSEYHQMILTLRAGDKLGQRDVIARLIAMQYTRNEQDFQRGTFACAATRSTSSRPNTRSWPCASNCSTTRWRRCSCSTR